MGDLDEEDCFSMERIRGEEQVGQGVGEGYSAGS